MAYSLWLKKESFKFSSSHFTIFGADHAEALHGHNYQVGVRLAFSQLDPKLEMHCDFNVIKEAIKKICDDWDEKILIPSQSPFLKISESAQHKKHSQVQYGQRYYVFPTNEIEFLSLANITSEGLARLFAEKLRKNLPKGFNQLSVQVKETTGQAASYSLKL